MEKKRTLEDAITDGPYRHLCTAGRTPSISGIPIKETSPKNLELSKHNSIIEERFSLYNEGETTAQLRKRIVEHGIDLSSCPSLISFLSIQTGFAESEWSKTCQGWKRRRNIPKSSFDKETDSKETETIGPKSNHHNDGR